MADSLNPTALSRLGALARPDWSRTVRARRLTAAALVMLAGVAALRPDPDGERVTVVVTGRDLRPGVTLTTDDIDTQTWLSTRVPDGAQTDPAAVAGATLAGPARRGEILTDVRLVGSRLAVAAAGPQARMVAIHPADPAVIALLRPGDVVDVLAATESQTTPTVLAGDAVVVSVSTAETRHGGDDDRVVLVALPAAAATTVAAAALAAPVALTLH